MTTVESSMQMWQMSKVWLSTEERDMRTAPLSQVIEVVNEILGYDLIQVQLLTEGYLLHREEDRLMAEGDMGAGFETLPPE